MSHNPRAEIEYHYSERNSDGLWCLPDNCYTFSYELERPDAQQPPAIVEFFGFDSNACQDHVVRWYPHVVDDMKGYISDLSKNLKASQADWKVLFAHHPIYTKGKGHGLPARCLRDSTYSVSSNGPLMKGFGLEAVLIDGGIDAYFAGHEHVFQYNFAEGIHHFCCGSSGADQRPDTGLYLGPNQFEKIDWIGSPQQVGFVAVEMTADQMITRFIDVNLHVIKEVVAHRKNTGPDA